MRAQFASGAGDLRSALQKHRRAQAINDYSVMRFSIYVLLRASIALFCDRACLGLGVTQVPTLAKKQACDRRHAGPAEGRAGSSLLMIASHRN
jgi:hypothetical protein